MFDGKWIVFVNCLLFTVRLSIVIFLELNYIITIKLKGTWFLQPNLLSHQEPQLLWSAPAALIEETCQRVALLLTETLLVRCEHVEHAYGISMQEVCMVFPIWEWPFCVFRSLHSNTLKLWRIQNNFLTLCIPVLHCLFLALNSCQFVCLIHSVSAVLRRVT